MYAKNKVLGKIHCKYKNVQLLIIYVTFEILTFFLSDKRFIYLKFIALTSF